MEPLQAHVNPSGTHPTKLFLLDAYALIFRAYYAFIRAPRINTKGLNTSAIFGFFNTLEELLALNPTHIGVAFDPAGGTFRHREFPEYKAQREETPEAIRTAVPYIKQLLAAYRIPVLEVADYEADDVIGTLATEAGQQGIETFMVTPDKDYGQLVADRVCMLKPRNGSAGFDKMGPAEVCEKWGLESPAQVIDMLGLMGDAADNIPGCKGVGEKTAASLIQQFGNIDNLLANTDQLKGALRTKVESSRDDIVLSRRLATIVTDVPIALDMEALRLREPDIDALTALMNELEMRTLLRRKLGDAVETPIPAAKPTSKKKSGADVLQLDLFAAQIEEAAPASAVAETPDETGDFETYNPDKANYQLTDTPSARAELMRYLMTAKEAAIDTETTSTDPMTAELVGLSFAVKEGEAFYVPVPADRTEAQAIVDEFRPFYENPAIIKVGQNLKYDLNVLAAYGIELTGELCDTMIAHYVLQPELHHGMDYLAEAYLHYRTIHIDTLIGTKKKEQRTMREVQPADVCPYAAEDADITLRLKNVFLPMLEAEGALNLFTEVEMPLMPVLARMERTGVRIDAEALRQTAALFNAQMEGILQEIQTLVGPDMLDADFNISSPRQVGVLLFEKLRLVDKPRKTKTGQYVTSEEVLESLRFKHPVVEKILEYRGKKKLLGTYLEALPKLVNPRTGHIHTSFNQTVAATGRLSSSNPNLQNIPVRNDDGREIRKVFIPEPGQLFFSADYSQIELRIMAHLSGDEHLIEAFREGNDIHAATAARIYKKDISEVTKDERRSAKTANFGIIYGISAFGLSERLGVSRQDAKTLIDSYFETYPGVQQYMQKSIDKARQLGYTETVMHRRCYLRDINSHNAVVRGYAERNAINAPIQGSAADIIKRAMIAIDRRFREEGLQSRMILQVHDELNFTVVPEERERVEAIVITEMQYAFHMSVPLIADCGWGENWLEAH